MRSTSSRYTSSRYNVPIRRNGALDLVFNCRTGAMVRVPAPLRPILEPLLVADGFDLEAVPAAARDLVGDLAEASFFVAEGFDEIEAVKRRLRRARVDTLALTVLPTIACNLRCVYCFQARRGSLMSDATCDALVAEVERRVREEGIERMVVDWFGGEPLLAHRLIRDLSARLMAIADRHRLPYRASMATNGTLLDEGMVEMLAAAGLESIQITLDGPPAVHDRRRPGAGGGPSFDAVLRGILVASERFRVNVRINVDRDTVDDAWGVLDRLEAEGCFAPGRDVLPYLALTAPLSSICSHTCGAMLPAEGFFRRVLAFQLAVFERRPDVDLRRLLELPQPLVRGCGAQNDGGLCVDPAGRVFKCGLEAHDPEHAAGRLSDDYRSHPNYRKWIDRDPFRLPECRDCTYLPLCLGGCPKYGADPDGPFYREACAYFESCLVPILATYARARS